MYVFAHMHLRVMCLCGEVVEFDADATPRGSNPRSEDVVFTLTCEGCGRGFMVSQDSGEARWNLRLYLVDGARRTPARSSRVELLLEPE